MPSIDLTDAERQLAGQACRVAARQAERDAAAQNNPEVTRVFEAATKRYAALAGKLDGSSDHLGIGQQLVGVRNTGAREGYKTK